MRDPRIEALGRHRVSRRSFLSASVGTLTLGLLAGCAAPASPPPAQPTAAPAAPKPSSAAAAPTTAAPAAAPSKAAAGQVVLRFGCPVAESTTQVQAMKRFADELGKLSGGQFKVEVYPNLQLGSLREMMENTQLGTQQMALVTPAVAAPFVRKLDVMTLLFLGGSIEKVYAAVDGSFGKRLDDEAQKAGLKILGWWYAAPRQFLNNRRPINTPDDLAGMKIRVINSPVWVKSISAIGANPVALDFGEVYSAMQQNVIDGYENLATDVYRGKFYEVAKYMSLSYHLYDVFTVFVNKKLYDGFTPEQQKMVVQAMKSATDWQRPAQAADIEESQSQLRKLIAVNDISEANRALFKEKVKPVWSQFEQDLGKDLIDEAIRAMA